MKRKMKVYTQEEVDAVNLYLQKRDALPRPLYDGTIPLGKRFYIAKIDGTDYMVRKEGPNFRVLFWLGSWKRFNFGERRRANES